MEFKKLLGLAKELNNLKDEDGNLLVAKKVKVVAVKEIALVSAFLDACESVSKLKEDLIPDNIAEAYNELIENDVRVKVTEKEQNSEAEIKPTKKEAVQKKDKSDKRNKNVTKEKKTIEGVKNKSMSEEKTQINTKQNKKNGIGAFVYEQLRKNSTFSNNDLCRIVLDKFPNANTKPSCIAWYKNKLRKNIK